MCAIGFQEHTRIAAQVALKEGHLHIAALYSGRQECRCVFGLAEECLVVAVLESHGEGLLLVGRVGEPCFAVFRKGEVGRLVLDNGLSLCKVIEAVGHALIVGAHLHHQFLIEPHYSLAVDIIKLRLTVEGSLYMMLQHFCSFH